jgi:hypothetical protein
MNFFAHGHRFVDMPYMVAGTALPDWLSVVDRKLRVRTRHAAPHVEHVDPRVAALARGVVQHHFDDRWFHATAAFAELSFAFAQRIRHAVACDNGFRCGFLGHLLVELLLDAELIATRPEQLDAYYGAVQRVDPELVATAVGGMATRPPNGLAQLIPHFSTERFLFDYGDDERLCVRINQVMRRVRLPPLPTSFALLLPDARCDVRQRKDELLNPPNSEKTE